MQSVQLFPQRLDERNFINGNIPEIYFVRRAYPFP
jgi:hypothetical protein